jgi:hypothetical protein
MQVHQKDNGSKGSFYIESDSKVVAEMTYVWAGKDRLIIDHTEVAPEANGKGLGKLLVAKAVEFARKNSIKIVPLCPFAKKVFEKTPEYGDVL